MSDLKKKLDKSIYQLNLQVTMKPLLQLIFILICVSQTMAQYPSFHSYSIENGGPSNEIYSILQDNDGYIWIGSDAGVYRFNGVNYEHFTSKDLLARSATRLIQSLSGRIYGYNFKGQIFYIDNDQLFVIKEWEGELNSLATDNHGYIWVTCQKGVFKIDDKDQSIKQFHSTLLANGRHGTTYTNNVRRNSTGTIFFQNTNNLFEITSDGKVSVSQIELEFDNSALIISSSKFDPWVFSFNEASVFRKIEGSWRPYTDKRFTELYHGRKPTSAYEIDGNLWLCTHTGVICMNLKSGNCDLLYPNMAFSGCIKDREGNYWLTTLHHGILKIPALSIRSWNRNNGLNGIEHLSHLVVADIGLIGAGTNGYLLNISNNLRTTKVLKHEPQSDIGMLYYDKLDNCVYFNKLASIYRIQNKQIHLVNNYTRALKDMLHTYEGYFLLSSQGIYLTQNIHTHLKDENMIAAGWYREICPSPFGKGYFVAGNDGLFE